MIREGALGAEGPLPPVPSGSGQAAWDQAQLKAAVGPKTLGWGLSTDCAPGPAQALDLPGQLACSSGEIGITVDGGDRLIQICFD